MGQKQPPTTTGFEKRELPDEARVMVMRAARQIMEDFRDNPAIYIAEARQAVKMWKDEVERAQGANTTAVKIAWQTVKERVRKEDRAALLQLPEKDERVVMMEVLAKLNTQ